MVGCDTMSGPIGGGSFDPLVPPGANTQPTVVDTRSEFRPGQIGAVSMQNAGFYNSVPRGNADPDRLLTRGTQVKIIASQDTYLKVELDDGKVGYVPSIMVEDPKAAPSPNEVQVYPPLSGSGTVPIIPLEPTDPSNPQAPGPEELPSVIEPDTPEPAPAPPPVPSDLGTPAPPIRTDTAEPPKETPPAGGEAEPPKEDGAEEEKEEATGAQ